MHEPGFFPPSYPSYNWLFFAFPFSKPSDPTGVDLI